MKSWSLPFRGHSQVTPRSFNFPFSFYYYPKSNWSTLNQTNHFHEIEMSSFYADTAPSMWMIFCSFQGQICRNSRYQKHWEWVLTIYGYCLSLKDAEFKYKNSFNPEMGIKVFLAYNQSDTTSGWNTEINGYTIFYNYYDEKNKEPFYTSDCLDLCKL